MKYCVHCGKELEDVADYCPNCGVKCIDKVLKEQETIKHKEDDKPLKGKTIGILMGIFVSIIGLLLCIFLGDEECKKSCIKSFIITTIICGAFSLLVTIIVVILITAGVIPVAMA